MIAVNTSLRINCSILIIVYSIVQMLATIVVLRAAKTLGVIKFPDMDLTIPNKVIFRVHVLKCGFMRDSCV